MAPAYLQNEESAGKRGGEGDVGGEQQNDFPLDMCSSGCHSELRLQLLLLLLHEASSAEDTQSVFSI